MKFLTLSILELLLPLEKLFSFKKYLLFAFLCRLPRCLIFIMSLLSLESNLVQFIVDAKTLRLLPQLNRQVVVGKVICIFLRQLFVEHLWSLFGVLLNGF